MTNADNASSEFNKHIKDVGKTVENAGVGGAEDAAKQASDYLKGAGERASELAGHASEYYQQGQKAALEAVKSQPLAALGIAALIGFLFGLLIAR
ncbi:MAG TPA: hypothetical protein VFE89_00140 [Beijerinckiaceae bacterium]|jgi:ElaB/YqjD/DUF883 family membrane-anchored ribosome-binding protein|nr:hypothetical protein [Beijerinckiaceae bacterium]